MKATQSLQFAAQGGAADLVLATTAYAACAAITWAGYRQVKRPARPY